MIDEADARILKIIQQNGRVSAQELGERAGVSAATAWRRVKALEEAGLVRGWRAVLDRERAGFAVAAYVHLTIERQYAKLVAEIERKIRSRPEVLECFATTGDADFTLRVVARDIADYDRFLYTFLLELPEVGQVRSSIALREIKETTELPI